MYSAKPAELWKKLGKHSGFIALLNSNRVQVTEKNLNVSLANLAERKDQFQKGYFDRNIERWGGFGSGRIMSYMTHIYLSHPDGSVKETWEKELEFISETIKKRASWMLKNQIENFSFVSNHWVAISVLLLYTPGILILTCCPLILVGYVIYNRRRERRKRLFVNV